MHIKNIPYSLTYIYMWLSSACVSIRMLTHADYIADACWLYCTYADVCWRMLTHADYIACPSAAQVVELNLRLHMDFRTTGQEGSMQVLSSLALLVQKYKYSHLRSCCCMQRQIFISDLQQDLAHASGPDVCWRMLTYADVCWRMLT